MRAKFIYEKFKEISDPIKDMGIGVEKYKKPQNDIDDFFNLVDEYMLELKGVKNWNKLKEDYFSYIKICGNEMRSPFDVGNKIFRDLKRRKLLEVNEKFTEKSDPIEDMGIGFPAIVHFKKLIKEVSGLLEQDLSKINFRDNAQKISQLREISGDLAVFYFNEKYGLNFKSEPVGFRGSNVGRAKLEKWFFDLNWSARMQSIKLTISDERGWQGIWKESSNCQSMRSLEQSLLKFCKELNITLPKHPNETGKRKFKRKV